MTKLTYNSAGSQNNPTARSAPRRTANRIFRNRFRNRKVDGIMKKRRTKTVDSKQTNAIYTLAKQVKKLQFQSFGDRQYQYQYAILQNTVANSLPLLTRPIVFPANCFYNNTNLMYGQVAPVPPHMASYANTPVSFHKQTFDLDIEDQFQWNEQRNQDTVSTVEYLPEYMKYKFRFMGSLYEGLPAYRYRITFFKMKNLPITSDKKNFDLPGAAGAYWHLCDDDASTRNYLSKSYHEVIADRFITFNPPDSMMGTHAFNKVVEIPIAFNEKVPLKPNIHNQPAGQQFWTNVPQKDIIWCVISSNMTVDGSAPTISIERVLHWRDKHGTTVGLD